MQPAPYLLLQGRNRRLVWTVNAGEKLQSDGGQLNFQWLLDG